MAPANPPLDTHQYRFRALWDLDALYLLYETQYGNWLQRLPPNGRGNYPIDFSGNTDAISIYFDPNVDDEPNFPPGNGQTNPFTAVDGYEIVFNLYQGEFTCGPTDPCTATASRDQGPSFGTFGEAHVNTLFGNQANWQALRLTSIAQANDANGGTAELRIPWAEFDADQGGSAGLRHDFAPIPGDAWFFQMGRTTTDTDNFLPVWNWTSSDFFAARPHGVITCLTFAADFDLGGDVDATDGDIWQSNFGTSSGANKSQGNADNDNDVDGADFLSWQAEFGSDSSPAESPAHVVPEPRAATLLILACALRCRRRRGDRRGS